MLKKMEDGRWKMEDREPSVPSSILDPPSSMPYSSDSFSASYEYCRRLARREAGNFYPAFLLLPRPQRLGMCALYAFLRVSDDLTDEPGAVEKKRRDLETWRGQLDQALAGECSHPLHPALRHTVETFGIPREYLDAALDGVAMDLDTARYETFDELKQYCYRVASVVGLSCIRIWGCTDERARSYAEAAGIALQLTNILRDLGEDAARGRIYLPLQELKDFGYSEKQLLAGERTEAFRKLMQFQVARARQHYESARPLAGMLAPAGRAVFLMMTSTYHALLDAIERRDYDVFSSRVRLTSWRKLCLAMRVLPARLGW